MSNAPTLYALLVGIDRYDPRSRVPNLRGCVNDVAAMAELLQRTFGVPEANIRRLTNEAATHQAIKLAFRHFLIEKAKAWAQAGRSEPPPVFLFHYSGHGSQARDETGIEPDGMDETLVAHDSRLPGIYDLKDWELGQFISELNEYSDNVTIILDCCHSGSGTRDVQVLADATVAQTRRCPPDPRPQPPESQRPATLGAARAINTSNWELMGEKHVLLAGCRDKEESNEYALVDGNQRRWHGAMTYFLQRELAQLPPNTSLTYRELHERIRQQVNTAYPNQMPQCEGDRDREFLGGLRPQRDAFYNVIDKREGLIWIDGGVVHGLTTGALLDLYPPSTRTLADGDAPLARLQLAEEGAVVSGCSVVRGDAAAIALHSRCLLYQLSYSNTQRKVILAVPDTQLATAIQQRLAPQQDANIIDVSNYLRVVDGAADFRVALHNGQLEIQDNSGQLLVAPFVTTDLDGLAADLAHLARYHNALALRNTAPHSELAGAIRFAIKELTFDPATQAPVAQEIQRTPGGELINSATTRVVWEITNQSNQPLYVALLGFAYDWSVAQLYPSTAGAHEALAPGHTLSIGLSAKRSEQFVLVLPTGGIERRDYFKVIATVQETDFAVLLQGALQSPWTARQVAPTNQPLSALDQLLQGAAFGSQRSAFGPPPATVADEWTTAELEVTTVAAPERMTRAVTGGVRTALPAFALEIEPPVGFTGNLRIVTANQSTRAANNTMDLQSPPAFAAQPERFVPVSFAATRAAVPGGAFLEIEADDAARQTVTPATPLKLHLNTPTTTAEPHFVIAFDGSFYYPVGRSTIDLQTVAIDWLPPSDAEDVQPLRSTRGVGRVLKLYLYKMVGVVDATLGLRRVRFAPLGEAGAALPDETAVEVPEGVLYYSAVDPEHFHPNDRIAVGIHGFSAESKEQARWLCTAPAQAGIHYDHVLTFDYESFNTGLSENGRMLADALRAARLERIPGLQIDLFAHSMGTMIARCMVELWGGDALVTRCFLAGPPNGGTRLAEIKKFVPWVTTLALNDVAFWTPAAIGSWVLQKLAEDGVAVEDLRPSAQILHDLNRSTKPLTTPYFILAGQNNKPLHLDATAWERLKHKVLGSVDVAMDVLFSDQNDLVIAVQSMLNVRNGQYPANLLKTADVNCTHFEYFTNEEAQQQLLAWLNG